jgi:hypothetical protein
MSHRIPTMLLLALCAALSACGGDADSNEPAGEGPFAPSGSASPGVSMIDPPADYTTIDGEGFAISTPGEFQQRRATSSNGEPMLVLEKPSQVPAIPQRVAVIRDVDPKSSAEEQSFALETSKAAAGPEASVQRVTMPAPEGQSAFLITWTESRPSEGSDNVGVTYWQLMHQVGEDLILNVVAYAPTDEFGTSEVSKILRTFEPGDDA